MVPGYRAAERPSKQGLALKSKTWPCSVSHFASKFPMYLLKQQDLKKKKIAYIFLAEVILRMVWGPTLLVIFHDSFL